MISESQMERLQLPEAIRERLRNVGESNLTCEEMARQRVEQINQTPGHLEGLDCPACMNRGYFARLDGLFRPYSEECQCMVQRRSTDMMRRSGLEALMERYTMDTWKTPEPWQARAKDMALQYVDHPDGKWFCMVGSVGTGKSHLCTALTSLLIERGMEARYMLWRDVSVRAKAVVNDDAEYNALVNPLKRVKVLYIDDLFKIGKGGQPTTGDVNLAFEIINFRYGNPRLLTIISSERTMDELLDIDEAVGSRIYERAKGYYLPLVNKKNWRLSDGADTEAEPVRGKAPGPRGVGPKVYCGAGEKT